MPALERVRCWELYFKYPRYFGAFVTEGLGDEMDRIAAYPAEFGYKRVLAKVYLSRLGRLQGFLSRTPSNDAD